MIFSSIPIIYHVLGLHSLVADYRFSLNFMDSEKLRYPWSLSNSSSVFIRKTSFDKFGFVLEKNYFELDFLTNYCISYICCPSAYYRVSISLCAFFLGTLKNFALPCPLPKLLHNYIPLFAASLLGLSSRNIPSLDIEIPSFYCVL